MRTYEDIYKDYCSWLVLKTGNEDYKYETILKSDDPKTVKSFLYKSILELCYDPKDGLYYFSKFIIGDLKDVGYPKPFRFNTLLRKWDRLVKVHKKLAILCARGHGKCLSGETLISMANGTTKKLMNIKTNDEVISFNEKTMKLEKDHAIYPTYVGDKKIQQIKTKFGKKIDCASTHRFYTINGWKQTKDLKPGDYIAIPRISKNIYSSNTIPKELAYILGWLISEGRYNSSIGISQKNKEVLSYIKSICDKLKIKATIGKNEEKPDICISNKFFKNLSYFEELKGKNSYTKYIPQEIMQQSDEIKWHFLSSLFEGDGYLDSRRGKNMGISYSSMSEKLINDLHHLLLTININSKKYISIAPMVTKKYGKKMPVYNLKIVRSDIIIFLNNTFYISKNQQKQKILKYFNKTKRNTNIDIIPKFGIFTNKYIGDSKHFTKPSAEKYIEKKRIDFLNGFQKNGERYETLKEIYNSSDLKKLEILKNSDIFWDEIKIIETHETIPMYDMQVLKNNTYIANDIITHNSVFFSEIFTLYDMFLFKYRRSILISASQEQVNHLIDEIKSIVEANEWLITKKNDNRWASTTIGYNKGYIIGAGIGSEILGQHVDRIILDDVLRDDNKISDEEIEDFVDMKLDPMLLNRDGQMVIVGTPKRPKDIFSVIKYRKKENPKCPWEIVEYKAVIDYEKKILQCPDRFSWDDIMKKRLSMGPLKFAREYQLEFFSRDKSLFPTRIVDPAKKKGLGRVLEHKPSKRTPNWLYVAGVDCARSGSVSADYTVMIVLAYDSVKQTKQIVYMWREKGLKTTEQAKHIAAIAKKFDNCMCVVETNNMGQTLVDELVDTHNTFVEPLTVGGHAKKDELVRFLINSFENEQLVIPRGDDFSRIQMDVLEDELGKFCVTRTPAGNERFEGVGSHDDAVDALCLANKGTQILGVPFAVTDFDKSGTIPGSDLSKTFDRDETDLVKLIKMGIIK